MEKEWLRDTATFSQNELLHGQRRDDRLGGDRTVPAGPSGRARSFGAATLARTIPETVATNSSVNPGGGRIFVDIGKSTERERTAQQIGAELRSRTSLLVGAEFTVLDDLNNDGQPDFTMVLSSFHCVQLHTQRAA